MEKHVLIVDDAADLSFIIKEMLLSAYPASGKIKQLEIRELIVE